MQGLGGKAGSLTVMVDLPAFRPNLSSRARVIFFWATIWKSEQSGRGQLLSPGDPALSPPGQPGSAKPTAQGPTASGPGSDQPTARSGDARPPDGRPSVRLWMRGALVHVSGEEEAETAPHTPDGLHTQPHPAPIPQRPGPGPQAARCFKPPWPA